MAEFLNPLCCSVSDIAPSGPQMALGAKEDEKRELTDLAMKLHTCTLEVKQLGKKAKVRILILCFETGDCRSWHEFIVNSRRVKIKLPCPRSCRPM